MKDPDCIFCKIAAGEAKSYRIWENEKFLAFLSIYPNTEGVTVVIPKDHYDTNVLSLPENVLTDLILTTKTVSALLQKAFRDVGRVGIVIEGFGVNHFHAKLYPLHGTNRETWRAILSTTREYHSVYEGYLVTNDGPLAEDIFLQSVQQKILEAY